MRVSYLERANWSVAWIKPNGKVHRLDFRGDFHEAKRIFKLAVEGERTNATLFCTNVGYEPPEKIKIRIKAINAKGFWWCPYCTELRKFVYHKNLRVDGMTMEEPGMYCPLCGVSNRDMHVRKHNPSAALMQHRTTKSVEKPLTQKQQERKERRAARRAARLAAAGQS